MVQNGDQDQRQPAPNEQDFLHAIVSDDRHIVLNIWIAIEELVALAEDQNAATQKDNYGDSECDPQRWDSGLFNHRFYHRKINFHRKSLPMLAKDCREASVGFSTTSEERIATPSSEVNAQHERLTVLASSLVAFGGEDRFWIGARNFAYCDPTNAADQRTNQK